MPSIFTRIIRGELPGRFVWKDSQCVALLTINPIRPGHTLVVPREEIDHWLDVPPALSHHLHDVAHHIGAALQAAWSPTKVGLIIAGLEVRHVHYHLVPIWKLADLSFANADPQPRAADLDAAAETLRAQLRAHGHPEAAGS